MTAIASIDTAHAPLTVRTLGSVTDFHHVRSGKVVSFLRPSDTIAYASGDVISDSVEESHFMEFTNVAKINGGGGTVIRAYLQIDDSFVPAGDFELILFSHSPTPHQDNAPLALDGTEEFDGVVKLLADDAVDLGGSTLITSSDSHYNYVCDEDSTSIFALLVVRFALVPLSGTKFHTYIDVVID